MIMIISIALIVVFSVARIIMVMRMTMLMILVICRVHSNTVGNLGGSHSNTEVVRIDKVNIQSSGDHHRRCCRSSRSCTVTRTNSSYLVIPNQPKMNLTDDPRRNDRHLVVVVVVVAIMVITVLLVVVTVTVSFRRRFRQSQRRRIGVETILNK